MIITVIDKNAKHFERKSGKYVYRYAYVAIPEDTEHVSAAMEQRISRYSEAQIRQKVTEMCAVRGIANEYNASDYGYEV